MRVREKPATGIRYRHCHADGNPDGSGNRIALRRAIGSIII